ncbi:hypothetical protein QBC38DRAFT_422728 [Podospora fimiseda]|uniref:Aminoglycoside phosphotransferase domain-containing protein n=1 Tax=Podospora fimiseda TaxID=252190 RepID=A0AAN7BKB4_9PEZI|nr:hypothetical protein QBC38DRAFT_422728 [Podospora fimiseda]
MTNDWTLMVIDQFFADRKSPTRDECDKLALSITGASTLRQVSTPGSLSYTVICEKKAENGTDEVVASFRERGSWLKYDILAIAWEIHRRLVPEATFQGAMPGSDSLLGIYTMSFVPGVACLEVLSWEVEMDAEEESKHVVFIKHLARYFARCLSTPQSAPPHARESQKEDISRRLAILKFNPSFDIISSYTVSELEAALPQLFTQNHPQVLTNGDLSKTNILVDPDTYEITGIVDWSLAFVRPFGMELDTLLLVTGCMDMAGWHDYTCKTALIDAFWEEFWAGAFMLEIQEDDKSRKQDFRALAEIAMKIGAILCYGFQRNEDGSASEVVYISESMLNTLKGWFIGDQA